MRAVTLVEGGVALENATALSQGKLAASVTEHARALSQKIAGRRGVDMESTIVVFAGATGSGKSSLFNAVIGQDLARVAVTRPTTSEPLAVYGNDCSALLDWLGVRTRHQASDVPWLAGSDLVLVDLPDIDSTEVQNRVVAERLISQADVVVWVVDPQKYADGVLHLEFLSGLREQSGGMTVVLNQVDLLRVDDALRVEQHLRQILDERGFRGEVRVTSAMEGRGVAELRDEIVAVAATKRAAAQRLAADLRSQATVFTKAVEDEGGALVAPASLPGFDGVSGSLSRALGADTVARAAGQAYVHRGLKSVGLVWTRWIRSRRPDPLKRLHLQGSGESQFAAASSLVLSDTQQATTRVAVRRYTRAGTTGLPAAWRNQLVAEAEGGAVNAARAMDGVLVKSQDDYVRPPLWWRAAAGLQVLLAAAAGVGLVWLAAYWVAGLVKIVLPEPPYWGPIAVPTTLLAGGLLFGWLLGVLGRLLLRSGGRRTRRRVQADLNAQVAAVMGTAVVRPLQEALDEYGRFVADVETLAKVWVR